MSNNCTFGRHTQHVHQVQENSGWQLIQIVSTQIALRSLRSAAVERRAHWRTRRRCFELGLRLGARSQITWYAPEGAVFRDTSPCRLCCCLFSLLKVALEQYHWLPELVPVVAQGMKPGHQFQTRTHLPAQSSLLCAWWQHDKGNTHTHTHQCCHG